MRRLLGGRLLSSGLHFGFLRNRFVQFYGSDKKSGKQTAAQHRVTKEFPRLRTLIEVEPLFHLVMIQTERGTPLECSQPDKKNCTGIIPNSIADGILLAILLAVRPFQGLLGTFFGELSLRINDLVIGSASVTRNRSFYNLEVVAKPHHRGRKCVFYVVSPFPFPREFPQCLNVHAAMNITPKRIMHPFLLAQAWREEMQSDKNLNMARIAAREGFSRARVTQIMNLLELPQVIQVDLLNPPAPIKINQFSERRLRSLIALADTAMQMDAWRSWVTDLMNQVSA